MQFLKALPWPIKWIRQLALDRCIKSLGSLSGNGVETGWDQIWKTEQDTGEVFVAAWVA